MKNQKGFSLIELLIVVVIIGIIAAIAIPNLLAARRSANEGSAISSLRTIHGAEMTYQSTTGSGKFADLPGLATANLVDQAIGGKAKADTDLTQKNYDGTGGTASSFAVLAKPTTTGGVSATGTRMFGIATEGVIASADATSGTMALVQGTSTTSSTFGTGTALNN